MSSFMSGKWLCGWMIVASLAAMWSGMSSEARAQEEGGINLLGIPYGGGHAAPQQNVRTRPQGRQGAKPQTPADRPEPFAWGVYDIGIDWSTAVGTVETDLGFRRAGSWEAYETNGNRWGWYLVLWDNNNTLHIIEPTNELPRQGEVGASLPAYPQTAGLTFDNNAQIVPPTMHLFERRYQYDPASPWDTSRWRTLAEGHLTVNLDTRSGGSLIGVWGTMQEKQTEFGEWRHFDDPTWWFVAIEGF